MKSEFIIFPRAFLMWVTIACIFMERSRCCSDFSLNFTNPNFRLSARTMDLGMLNNFTITIWPQESSFPLNSIRMVP